MEQCRHDFIVNFLAYHKKSKLILYLIKMNLPHRLLGSGGSTLFCVLRFTIA
jgi:hypothetical protein